MTDKKEHIKHSMKSTAPADCVTEIRIGNSVSCGVRLFQAECHGNRSRQNG